MQNYRQFLEVEIWELLNGLQPETKAIWGVMSAQHMVEHLRMIFGMSLGFAKLKPFYDEAHTRQNYEYTIVQQKPIPRNIKLKDGFLAEPLPLEFESLDKAIAALKEAVEGFFSRFEQADLITLHPVLGNLHFGDWLIFHSAHVRHHFEQFGLIASAA